MWPESSCYFTCILRYLEERRRKQWQPTPVLLPGKSHGRRSLVGCSPRGHEESDTIKWLHFHFSLSCIGEGNGNPLQCSCLENSRNGGAWWAAVYGVAQSWTWLKRLSSSSRRKAGRDVNWHLRVCCGDSKCAAFSAQNTFLPLFSNFLFTLQVNSPCICTCLEVNLSLL